MFLNCVILRIVRTECFVIILQLQTFFNLISVRIATTVILKENCIYDKSGT